jgi:hypothetical protein
LSNIIDSSITLSVDKMEDGPMDLTRQLTADQMFRGLMAAVAKDGPTMLNGTRPQIHRAFRKVLDAVREKRLSAPLDVETFDIDFDPLYGQSSWLDRALTRAQRGRVISFPNPTYERMQVRFESIEAEEILDELGGGAPFEELARIFTRELPGAKPDPTTS